MKHQPDFEQFLKVLRRQGRPAHLPFYEHIASPGFIARRTGTPLQGLTPAAYWRTYVDFWIGMGFDCVPLEVPLTLKLAPPEHGQGGHASEAQVVIRNREDFEKFPWPSESQPLDFRPFELAASFLPPGAKLVAGVAMGPFEWASTMAGMMGLSYMLFDDPELVQMLFAKLGTLSLSAERQLASMDAVGALRQGDDLGFRTSTFLPSDELRRLVFPIYQQMAATAHKHNKPFILHSCGNLAAVYEDLIHCGIDAKHSFEEAIMPVEDFKKQYGQRITPLGGLDVDMICRSDPDTLRRYARQKIEQCFAADGYWAMGTGNSLTDYMPVENYLLVLEEGRKIAG